MGWRFHATQCDDPLLCPHDWALRHIPLIRFDKEAAAQEYCFPDEATNANNGFCKPFNPDAPIYYNIVTCGEFLKLAWHLWYGHQKGCLPDRLDLPIFPPFSPIASISQIVIDHVMVESIPDTSHDDDWERITINFIRDPESGGWRQDSVTFHQHSGHYTRANTQTNPDVWVGKIAHGSYDIGCDGVGFVWNADYCAGGCGYWDDFR